MDSRFWSGFIICAAFTLLFFILGIVRRLYMKKRCSETCFGLITDRLEEIERTDMQGMVYIVYSWTILYRVDGITCVYFRPISLDREKALATVASRQGMKIPVRYDPRKPSQAYTEDPLKVAVPVTPEDDLPDGRRFGPEEAREILSREAALPPRFKPGLRGLKRTVERASAVCTGEVEHTVIARKPWWLAAIPLGLMAAALPLDFRSPVREWLTILSLCSVLPVFIILALPNPPILWTVSYTVNKRTFTHHSRVRMGPRLSRDNVWLLTDACRGQKVPVHYDPDAPWRSWAELPVRQWTDRFIDEWRGLPPRAE